MELSLPPGALNSTGTDVSDDGLTVVGNANRGTFVWNAATGSQSLDVILGTAVPSGWTDLNARATSGDGLTIAGVGTNPQGVDEGWIATIPSAGTGVTLLIATAFAATRRTRRE